jgi:gas vesicle protein
MAQDHDFDTGTGTSGVAFALGLLAGAAIGVGLGLLFAPREGAALRREIAKRARDLRDDAGEQIDRVAVAADDLVGRGREVTERARSAVASGIREARRYGAGVAADVADAVKHTEA